jgi:hypothetical protein
MIETLGHQKRGLMKKLFSAEWLLDKRFDLPRLHLQHKREGSMV